MYQTVGKNRASREAAAGPDASGFSFERSVPNTSARAPRSGLRAVACACAWEGGGGPHPALSCRRPGVSGAVRSAEGYDCNRLSRSSARKAQLRTQGGGDSKGNFQPDKLLRRAAICRLLLFSLLPLGIFRAPSLSSGPSHLPQLGSRAASKARDRACAAPRPPVGGVSFYVGNLRARRTRQCWPLCAKDSRGLGEGERRLAEIPDLAARGGW